MTRPDTPAVKAIALRKVYTSGDSPPREALKSVDLTVPGGSVLGLLGPNGAGKSTLINILAGLVMKTSGTARILGWDIEKDMRRARTSIGIVPQELNLDSFFTPREVMDLQAGMYGVPKKKRRTMEILRALGLEDKADIYARSLSGGMRRRLLVAKALVHSPPVVVLDEPTAGVDVELRQSLWEYMKELNHVGTTILLTTHYLEEAEAMCDEIAIINRGQVVAQDSTSDLLTRLDTKEARITVDRNLDAVPDGLTGPGVEANLQGAREILIRFPPSRVQMGGLLDAIKNAGLEIADLTTHETDLEEIFVALTRADDESARLRRRGDPQAGPLETSRTRPSP